MFRVIQKKLSSGLQVIVVPMPALKSITALLLVNTGSRYEDPSEYGVAHLLEHLVFRGTKNYPDSLSLSVAVDSIGAGSNAFTSKEYTGFYVNAASTHLEFSLSILKEIIFSPLIRSCDVDQEKAVVIEEIKMYRDSPEDYISDEFEQMAYQGSSLEHPISGSIDSVKQQTAKTLKQFLRKWYGLENLTLVIAGDEEQLTKKGLFSIIGKIYSDQNDENQLKSSELSLRANHHPKRRKEFFTKNPFSQKKSLKHKRATEQVHVVMGWPALKRDDPQRYVLTVLATIMGGNRSSRLFQVVREQANLAYYVSADVDQYHDTGLLGVNAGLNSDKVKEGLKLIADEFKGLADGSKPISDEELKRAKDYLTGRILLGLESSRAVAQHYGLSWLLLGRIESPQDAIDGIKQVSLKELHTLAKSLIKPGELRLAMVGQDC